MQTIRKCSIEGCSRHYLCKGYCRLHWERVHRTGSPDDPQPRTGAQHSSWKGDAAGYSAIHLRMSSQPRPDACESCGATDTRFEWALRAEVDRSTCLRSSEGYAYSTDPADYVNLCKPCHNDLDLSLEECRKGHPLSGDNLYIQPGNGKRFCRACQEQRRAERTARELTGRGAR